MSRLIIHKAVDKAAVPHSCKGKKTFYHQEVRVPLSQQQLLNAITGLPLLKKGVASQNEKLVTCSAVWVPLQTLGKQKQLMDNPSLAPKVQKAVSMICKDPGAKLCTVEMRYNLKSESQIQQLKCFEPRSRHP